MSNKLKELRLKHGLTQQQLADVAGVSKVQISRMESGDSIPKSDVLGEMASELGDEVFALFEGVVEERSRWTREELAAAVRAYCDLMSAADQGIDFNKSDQIKGLREKELSGRTRASIEYRMQNISAVVMEMGLEPVKGYAPARNVGSNVKKEIRTLLEENGVEAQIDLSPVADRQKLEERSEQLRKRLRRKPMQEGPTGVRKPEVTTITTTAIRRDPLVRAWVLENANGICELCKQPAPFMRPDGTPYLEVHHVKTLADGGPDTIDNAIACCPNCHSEIHKGDRISQLKELLYKSVKRLVR
ncbi:helix-turn-helix domain-containing protein [Thalassospira sp. A40-3]|uniref:helix-turn-helix domain-containing protein n=1 Tax=Thalassospira sp. A40-3 TaxID=2785908 RepID=UPI0027389C24|nr:helix-turn-helix domain-containing protein [Thalassospira sp. A40-3]